MIKIQQLVKKYSNTLAVNRLSLDVAQGELFGLLFAPFLLFIANGVDGTLTYYVAKKGLHPRREPQPETEVEFVEDE